MVSINRKLIVAGASGFVIGTFLWLIASIASAVIPGLPPLTPLAGFGIGFGGAVAATLSEDTKPETSPK
jgi:hypothetical protein